MNVTCTSCGHKFDTVPPPHDPDGVVSCPKCLSTFATTGLASPSPRPRRKIRVKATNKVPIGPVVAGATLVLVAAAAVAYFVFFRPKSDGGSTSTLATRPDGKAVTPAASPAEWKEFAPEGGNFRVSVPATPTRTKLPNGSVEYQLDTGELIMGVVYADLVGPTLGKTSPDKVMTRERDELIKAGGRLVRERDVMAGVVRGTEFVIDLPGTGPTHFRYFTVKRRVYKLKIGGKAAPPSDRDVARFFDSFLVMG